MAYESEGVDSAESAPSSRFYTKQKARNSPGLLLFASLGSEVWEKSHVACALDSERDFALLVSRHAGALASDDLCMGVHELTKVRDVLVVNELLVLELWALCLICHGS